MKQELTGISRTIMEIMYTLLQTENRLITQFFYAPDAVLNAQPTVFTEG